MSALRMLDALDRIYVVYICNVLKQLAPYNDHNEVVKYAIKRIQNMGNNVS